MAPCSLLAATSPFVLHSAAGRSSSRRPLTAATSRRTVLRVAALKYEPSKVAPQADRVLVRLEQIPEKSAGGVLLPKSAVKFERYLMGEILSVGADVCEVEAGKKIKGLMKSGKFGMCGKFGIWKPPTHFVMETPSLELMARWVIFSDINAYEVDLGSDEKHCFCRESDLLAVVE